MKVVIFMATSLNGFIARPNGNEDFLSHENWDAFSQHVNKHQNFIVGRQTYEAVNNWSEGYGFDDFTSATKVIVSKNKELILKNGYQKSSNILSAIDIVKRQANPEICMITGGAFLNTSVLNEKLADEIWINLEPVMIPKGINFLQHYCEDQNLSLISCENQTNNILHLKYKVLN